jgi:hypothetical protein
MISAKLKIKWNGPKVAAAANAAALAGLEAGGEELVRMIRRNIGVQGPPSSAPGEFPHKLSGELAAGIGMTVNRSRKTVSIYSSAPHGPIVEETRPHIRRTYRESKATLRRVVLDTSQQKFGHFRIA